MSIDIYCRPSLVSGGSGTESDPYGSVADAYSNASNGQTIGIDTTTGVYLPTAQVQDTKGVGVEPWIGSTILTDASAVSSSYMWRAEHVDSYVKGFEAFGLASGKYMFRINADIKGFDDVCIRDCDGDAVLHSSGSCDIKRLRIARCRIGYYLAGGTGTVNLYGFYAYDLALYNRINAASASVSFHHVLLGGNVSYCFWVQNGVVDIYSGILIGGGKNAATDTIKRDAGTVTLHSGVATYPVLDSGSFLKGFTNVTVNSSVLGIDGDSGKTFSVPRRQSACISFCRDDLEDYISGGSNEGEYDVWLDQLELRGFRGTYALSTQEAVNPDAISEAGWRDIQKVIDRGHDIATHGRTGYHIHNDNWFTVQYTGSASLCRLVVVDDVLMTYEDGVEDLRITLQTNGYRLSNLVSEINSDSNYTCTMSTTDGGSSDAGSAPAHLLADVDIADIKASSETLVQDPIKAADWEIIGCQSDIFSNTGYLPLTHIYSAGSYNIVFADRAKRQGFIGGRLGAAPNSPFSGAVYKFWGEPGYDPFQNFGILVPSFLDDSSETTIKRYAVSLCEWAMWHGAQVVLYAHAFSELSAEKWGYVFDVVKASGIYSDTVTGMFQRQASLPLETNTKDDQWVPVLDPSSTSQGIASQTWTGKRHRGFNGEPFPDFGIDPGVNQSLTAPFHPNQL